MKKLFLILVVVIGFGIGANAQTTIKSVAVGILENIKIGRYDQAKQIYLQNCNYAYPGSGNEHRQTIDVSISGIRMDIRENGPITSYTVYVNTKDKDYPSVECIIYFKNNKKTHFDLEFACDDGKCHIVTVFRYDD